MFPGGSADESINEAKMKLSGENLVENLKPFLSRGVQRGARKHKAQLRYRVSFVNVRQCQSFSHAGKNYRARAVS